ncbi:MAG TPA: class I SAM-dependent methyltransferase [Thermoanaerobaculia bacterium]|nr:class I SAM-dependent methyltransferase [Thermoanaerobaculia bacterium]
MIRLVFPESRESLLGRLSRRRWKRAFDRCPPDGVLEVRDETALAAPGVAEALIDAVRRNPGAVVYPADSAAEGPAAWRMPAASTLRELEEECPPAAGETRPIADPPDGWAARFVPAVHRGEGSIVAAGFRVVRFPASFGVREEVVSRIPASARRLLDVGCGAGETAAAARERLGLRAEGIERDPRLAEAARARLDAVHAGDALEVMRDLGREGRRFDVLVFADVLEHLPDPWAALEAARALAAPGASLIACVPNAGGEPILADLIEGRFDPVAAGPEDAGHLRWFTRRSLRELLEEAGFRVGSVDPVRSPRDGGLAARLAAAGLPFDPEALGAIQWIATATAEP